MTDAHKVVDYLKDHFNESDIAIVMLIAQGIHLTKIMQGLMMEKGIADIPEFDEFLMEKLEEMDAFLSDVINEEAPYDRF